MHLNGLRRRAALCPLAAPRGEAEQLAASLSDNSHRIKTAVLLNRDTYGGISINPTSLTVGWDQVGATWGVGPYVSIFRKICAALLPTRVAGRFAPPGLDIANSICLFDLINQIDN